MKIFVTLAYSVFVIFSIPEVNGKDDDFNIDVKQKNAEVYHEQSSKNNEFNYGYQVEKENSQFQHKVKGPDDVTYGCYGYIDPNNEKHLVYYVADRLGYRIVPPNQPTKIFTERVASSINKLNKDLKDKKLDEKVVAWNDLYLPDSCRRLDEILTITTAAPQSGKGNTNGNSGKNINIPVTTKTTTRAPFVITTPANINFKRTGTLSHIDSTTEFVPRNPSTAGKHLSANGNGRTEESLSDQNKELHNATLSTTTSSPYAGDTFDPVYVSPHGLPAVSTIAPKTTGYNYPVPKNPLQDSCQPQSNPLIGQYNGYVYPINSECSSTEYNVRQLMSQMESLNQQVLELTANIRVLQQANSSSPDCHQWLSRQQFPLLIYVPILLPYLGNGFDGGSHQQSFKNPASYAFQKMCEECISK